MNTGDGMKLRIVFRLLVVVGATLPTWARAQMSRERSVSMGVDVGMDGVGVNTGAGVDWMFLPKVGVGVHVTWNKVIVKASANGSMQEGEGWVDTGAGIALLW